MATPFDIPNAVRFKEGSGGLALAAILTAATEAELYLQGAHLARWQPSGQQPVLFVSPTSLFARGKAIRGGVPLVFPWFGPRGEGKPGPAHGFARTEVWEVESIRQREDQAVEIALALGPNESTRAFCRDFRLRFRVKLGTELEMELEAWNAGEEPLAYEEAMHTYFAVSDIHRVSVTGLEGTIYLDKTDGFKRKPAGTEPIRFRKETDQVYLNTASTCVIHDPGWNRRIVIEKSGSESTVVWNPWAEKAATISDLAEGSWKEMLCIESGNIADNAVRLMPGMSHKLTVTIHTEAIS